MSIWLAIDTATDQAGVALHDGSRVLVESSWTSRRRHTVELGPTVERVLSAHDLQVDDLAGLAVAIGPGSYTGLRIGLSFAKGLALGSGLPLVPVPTLDIVAVPLSPPHCPRSVPLLAVLSAGRGRVVAGQYGVDAAGWPDPTALVVETVSELARRVDAPAWVAGELSGEERGEMSGAGLTVLAPSAGLRRPGWLCEIGRERFSLNGASEVAEIVPIYLGH